MSTSTTYPTIVGRHAHLSPSAEQKPVNLAFLDQAMTASPSSVSLTAPPPSPVHTSSSVPSSPFAFSSPLSIRTSLPYGPSPSASHIPPLVPIYDDEKFCSSSSSSTNSSPAACLTTRPSAYPTLPPHTHDHADGQAWVDDSEKVPYAADLTNKLSSNQNDKHSTPSSSSSSSSHHTPTSSTSPLDSPRRLFQLNLKEQERQAKAAEHEHQLSLEQKKQAAEDDKYTADQHKLLHLLTCMYRCRECMPTWKDREEQRLGIETNEYSSRRLNEYCCIGSALQSSFPPSLPLDLLPLMQAYLLTQPTRSFLTHPAPPSAGVIQCYILKKNNRFELYMEMRDHTEWQNIRKRMVERGHLQDTQQSILPPTTANSGGSVQGDKLQQSVTEKERERSELLERLFRERQAMRQMWKGGKGSMSPVNSGKGSSQSLGLEDRMKENNMKSMLLSHAEQLLMKNEDIFLLAATRKRAWRGNSYTITMEDDSSKASSGSESSGGREYIGKLKSNFGGTEFVMFDYGTKASKKSGTSKKTDKTDSGNGSVTPLSPLSSPLIGGAVPTLGGGGGGSSMGGGQRYQRESGVIQYDHFFEHTGSPIRIKIMLPNRSFYPLEQSQLSGSILRQYKAESKDSQQGTNNSSQPQQSVAGAQPTLADEEDDEFTPPPNAATQSTTSASASTVSSPPPSPSNSPLRPKATEPDEYDYQTTGQHIELFENLRPVWHDGMNAYVLHFDNHRVREKSVKNFKLVRMNDGEKRTVLQFGRVMDRNVFVMDYAWPLSAAQAFAICLSSIDPKIAV